MAVIGSATLNVIPKVQGGLANAINGEIAKANVSGLGRDAGAGFMGGFASGASIGTWSAVASRAIGAVTSSLDSAVSRVDTLNNFPRVMESLGVGSEAASRSISTMSDALSNVPTRLDDMASVVQGLYAATDKYGTSIGTVTDAGLALNSMLLAGGQSQTIVNSAMEQFRQMVSKGKPELQDWKSLIQAAPGQLNQLAKEMLGATATADDLYAALGGGREADYSGAFEWGSIGMDELVERMAGMRGEFEAAAEDAQGGIGTAFSNMTNSVTKGVANVLDAFGQDRIASAIGDVRDVISSVFGTDDSNGLRSFATEVAPLVSDAWGSMMERAKAFGDAAGPYIDSLADKALSVAREVGPSVEGMLDTLVESGIELLPTLADVGGEAIEAIGDTARGIADMVEGVAPTVTAIAKDVLPMVADVIDVIGPALPAIVAAKAAFGGLGSVLGGLSGLGSGIEGLAGGIGRVAQVLPTIGGLADVGPAIATIAGGAPLATAALSPMTLAIGAAAAGATYLGAKFFEVWHEGEELRQNSAQIGEAISDMRGNFEGLGQSMATGVDHTRDFGSAAGEASLDIDRLIGSIERHNRSNAATREEAEQSVYMLGQYREVIDQCAGQVEVSSGMQAKLEWALRGVREATGEAWDAQDVLTGKYRDSQGEIHSTIDAIDELIQKKQQEARVNALQDMYTDTIKESVKAQRDLNRAQSEYDETFNSWAVGDTGKSVIKAIEDMGVSYDEAREKAKATFEMSSVEGERVTSNLRNATDAVRGLTEEEQGYAEMLGDAVEQANAKWGEREGVIMASKEMRDAISGMSFDAAALSSALEGVGVSSDQLREVGGESFARLAEMSGDSLDRLTGYISSYAQMGSDEFSRMADACDGDMGRMRAAMDAYNSTPIQEKDGRITVDGAMLADGLGNIYTWNGVELVDHHGRAIADDADLMDAYGNVVRWNNTDGKLISANIQNSSNPIPDLIGWLDSLRAYDGTTINTYSNHTNTTRNVVITETAMYTSGGHQTANAAGGHIEPRHAGGYIAAGPTHTNFGLVGEDGIEAVYNNPDGSSDVYPLTNPRYLGYADPLGERIARSVMKAMGALSGRSPVNVTINGVSGPDDVARAVTRALTMAQI